MKRSNTVIALLAAAGACLAAAPASAEPVVYEGSLSYLDAPVSSTADLRFRLFDAAEGGAQLGPDVVIDAATLDKGAFKATLDFGAFDSGWIEVAVRAPSGNGEFVTLAPRQRLDAAIINADDGGADASTRGGNDEPGASLSLTHRAPRGPGLDPAGGGIDPSYSGGLGGFDTPGHDTNVTPAGPFWQLSGGNLFYLPGNVGVGTSMPTVPLHIVSPSAAQSILGVNSAINGRGVTGLATGGGGVNFGVFGISFSPDGSGVFGQANTSTGSNFGVTGLSDSSAGVGVRGLSSAASGNPIGVLGQVTSGSGISGWFVGGRGAVINTAFDSITGWPGNTTINGTRLYIQASNSGPVFDNPASISSDFDLVFERDVNADDGNTAWFSFYEGYGAFFDEKMRIEMGVNPPILGDGAFTSNGLDYAEAFHVLDDSLEPGDVVAMILGDARHVVGATTGYQSTLVGVVSERPSFIAGASFELEREAAAALGMSLRESAELTGAQRTARRHAIRDQMDRMVRPIALAGRVPVKVDASHGAIRAGDRLTSSPTPGHAMVQTRPGPSIGIALEDFSEGQGKIIVLIQPGWTGLTDQQYDQLEDRNADLEARIQVLEQLILETP